MIRYSTEPNSPVVELTVEGRVSDADLKAAIARLRDDLERNGKTRVLEVIRHFTGIEPQALWTDLRLGLPLAHKVSRVAVVADQAWIRAASHLGRFFISAELKAVVAAHKLKLPRLAMPLRVMVTGAPQSPSIDAVLELLGRDQALHRIDAELAQFPQ